MPHEFFHSFDEIDAGIRAETGQKLELEKKRKDLLSTECEFANPALDGSGPPAMLDAPVSGGILSAENGSLIFMFKEKTYSRDQIVDEMRVEWAECIQREI
ncbi:hypothetical protein ACS0TY_034472 [Phlomoides rotata]